MDLWFRVGLGLFGCTCVGLGFRVGLGLFGCVGMGLGFVGGLRLGMFAENFGFGRG